MFIRHLLAVSLSLAALVAAAPMGEAEVAGRNPNSEADPAPEPVSVRSTVNLEPEPVL